jgi:putative nucleotidyltransferase with HDIG domain
MKTRDEAFALLAEHTKSESLIKHALAVEAAMRWYAQHFSEDGELWGITGLLHDFDYEQYPNLDKDGHPFVGCKILEDLGYTDLIIEAILGHATYSGVERKTKLAKVLFASDELCGLIVATTLVRPDRSLHSLSVKSVKKKMKDKSFARTIHREDIILGTEELGIEIGQHIQNVIEGMKTVAPELGLNGSS